MGFFIVDYRNIKDVKPEAVVVSSTANSGKMKEPPSHQSNILIHIVDHWNTDGTGAKKQLSLPSKMVLFIQMMLFDTPLRNVVGSPFKQKKDVDWNEIAHIRCTIPEVIPKWQGGVADEESAMHQCYGHVLRTVSEKGCKSIVFPLLGDGDGCYPIELAIDIALTALREYSLKLDVDIYLAPNKSEVRELLYARSQLMRGLLDYLDTNYRTDDSDIKYSVNLRNYRKESLSNGAKQAAEEVEKLLPEKEKGILFWEYLQALMERTGKGKVEIYKNANLDRRIISKIKKAPNSIPSKSTVLALAIALHLSLEDTESFLEKAGYALSPWTRSDVIIEYFIKNEKYDIDLINEVLYGYGAPMLGSMSWEERKY